MTDTKCIAPWIHLHTWPNNNVYPCCLTSSDDIVGNLKDNTLEEIWNSSKMKQLRLDMLQGRRPPSCARCFEQEDHGQGSLRTHLNNTFTHHMDKMNNTKSDGSLDDFSIVYWDFRFSNICNMRCRMCGPQLSSGWYEDTKKLWGSLPQDLPDPKTQPDLWSQIEPLFDTVEDIYFAGGEPLLMEEHYNILNRLVEMKKHDVVIRYNSNFSQLKYKKLDVLDVWPLFKRVEMGASLDAYGDLAEYIRKGTIWNDIVENRKQMKDRSPNARFFINCTIGAMNSYHIVDFHKYALETRMIELPSDFHINLIQTPECLSMQVLPKHHKERLTRIYSDYAKELKANNEQNLANQFESLISYMNAKDNTKLIYKFQERIGRVDKIRNESFIKVVPELKDMMQ